MCLPVEFIVKTYVNSRLLTSLAKYVSNCPLFCNGSFFSSQTLEPAELQERAFEYGRQLQLVSSKLAQKYAYLKSGKSDGLQDISANQVDRLVQSEVLNSSDKLLIRFLKEWVRILHNKKVTFS